MGRNIRRLAAAGALALGWSLGSTDRAEAQQISVPGTPGWGTVGYPAASPWRKPWPPIKGPNARLRRRAGYPTTVYVAPGQVYYPTTAVVPGHVRPSYPVAVQPYSTVAPAGTVYTIRP